MTYRLRTERVGRQISCRGSVSGVLEIFTRLAIVVFVQAVNVDWPAMHKTRLRCGLTGEIAAVIQIIGAAAQRRFGFR